MSDQQDFPAAATPSIENNTMQNLQSFLTAFMAQRAVLNKLHGKFSGHQVSLQVGYSNLLQFAQEQRRITLKDLVLPCRQSLCHPIGNQPLKDNHRSALVYALVAFSLLSVGDVIVKSMAGVWPGTAISALRYCIGAIGLGSVLMAREGRAGFAYPKFGWQLVRGVGVSVSAVAFFSAVQLMPIGEATAISFTSPMITALLAAVMLSEPLRRETWIASAVAFAGVLTILRPNFALLGWFALLPVASAAGMAFLMIANRKVVGTGSALAMQFNVASIGAICLLIAAITGHFSGVAFFAVAAPTVTVLAKCAFIAVTATTAHACLFMAAARADAGVIAPMTYVQLLLAGVFGWVLFGERPDAIAVLGSLVIVAAGLYLWRSGRAPAEPVMTD